MANKERDYKTEYAKQGASPAQIKQRAENNKARAIMKKKLGGIAIKGKDIAHKNNNTSDNRPSNLKVQSKSKNRSFPRNKSAGRK